MTRPSPPPGGDPHVGRTGVLGGGGAFIVDEFEARHGVFLHTLDIASDVESRLAERLLHGKKDKRCFGDFLFPAHVYGGAACRVEVDDNMLLDLHIVQYTTLSADATTPKSVTLRTDIMPLSSMVAFYDPAELEAWVRRLFRCTRIVLLATPQRAD